MDKRSTGSEIVGELAGGRSWWQLQARDLERWLKTLHVSATQELVSRTEWIGDAWDGKSDIKVGNAIVSGCDVAYLLSELQPRLLDLGLTNGGSLVAGSVRQCFAGPGACQTLTIDIDLGDWILPICIDERSLEKEPRIAIETVAGKMIEHVRAAHSRRSRIMKRELRLRRALEQTAAKIGEGVAPLWLRMEPIFFWEDSGLVTSQPYVMILVTLNDCLVWSPVGTEHARTLKNVRDWYGYSYRYQKARAARLAGMHATRSIGWISEVALAVITDQGLDPRTVFQQAVDARRADRRGGVHFTRHGRRETLYYRDGTLIAWLEFEGGVYYDGQLSLSGDYPEALTMTAKGLPIGSFIDHPALRAPRMTIMRTESGNGELQLHHKTRLIPVEATCQRLVDPPQALAA